MCYLRGSRIQQRGGAARERTRGQAKDRRRMSSSKLFYSILLAAANLPALVRPPTRHDAFRASRALLRAHRFTRRASLLLQALAAVGARRGLRRWRRRGRRGWGHSTPISRQRRQPRHGAGKNLSCAAAARLRIALMIAARHQALIDHGRVVLRQRRAELEDDLRHR